MRLLFNGSFVLAQSDDTLLATEKPMYVTSLPA